MPFSVAGAIGARFVEAYMEAYEKEEKAFKRIDRKELTRKMNEADTERINDLRIIRDALKIFLIMRNEQKRIQAGRILEAIDLYGGGEIYTEPIDARTGDITNIIEDLETDLGDAVRTLEIEPAVENLKAANELYLQCQHDRDLSDAEFGKGTMSEARAATDEIWRAVVETVNNAIAYGTDEQREVLIPFALYMNVEIDKYRIQTGQGVGGNWDSGSSATEEDGVRLKTATFVYVGGTEVKLKVEVGTPLIAPDNTPGYYWPDLPEFMPKRSFTVREVPIEEEGSEDSENSELDPAENIKIVFKNQFNQPVHEVIVPVDYQMTEEEFPTPPEGTHWNFTLADLNLAIGMKNPGDTITVRAQA